MGRPMVERLLAEGYAVTVWNRSRDKLEPVVADGGELVILAPHVTEVSYSHGEILDRIGYHVRDYFLKQMDRFSDIPRGVMAHDGCGTCGWRRQPDEDSKGCGLAGAVGPDDADDLARVDREADVAQCDDRLIDVGLDEGP